MPVNKGLFFGIPLLIAGLAPGLIVTTFAKPPSLEEGQRQQAVVREFEDAVAAESTPAGKLAVFQKWLKPIHDVEIRRKGLAAGERLPAAERETFLTEVLASDEDAGLRSQAAELLGRLGSEKSIATLTKAAASDPTTAMQMGCIVARSSARRSATFALADLALRVPKSAEKITQAVRDLQVSEPQDGEQLADARRQALYQLTKDEVLLQPFFERLKSEDAKTRESGVIAFRFLRLKTAPAELVATLKDDNDDVRLWSSLVLGEIGDPKTAPLLLEIAADTKQPLGTRANALQSLGRMKVPQVAADLRKLVTDEAIGAHAAIALYRLTGEKSPQFPTGYPVEPPGCN